MGQPTLKVRCRIFRQGTFLSGKVRHLIFRVFESVVDSKANPGN